MLAFPSPSWQKALNSVIPEDKDRPRGVRFGRTASLIVPRVYLSDVFTARDPNELSRLGITHVISVLDKDPNIPDDVIPIDRRLHIWLRDGQDVDILSHLPKTTEYIIAALAAHEDNKILVHCWQGISRSATVVCAYLMASSNMRASEALKHMQAKRGVIGPNQGFRAQLDTYADSLIGKSCQDTTKPARKPTMAIGGGIATRIRQLKLNAAKDA